MAVLACVLLLAIGPAAAMSPDDLQTLEAAGLEADTIALLLTHRSLETGQLTVAQLVALKRAGLGPEALRRFIEQGSFVRRREPRVYRSAGPIRRFVTVEDLVALKAAGIDDRTLEALVTGEQTGGADADGDRRRAWKLLERMGIVVDQRTAPAP